MLSPVLLCLSHNSQSAAQLHNLNSQASSNWNQDSSICLTLAQQLGSVNILRQAKKNKNNFPNKGLFIGQHLHQEKKQSVFYTHMSRFHLSLPIKRGAAFLVCSVALNSASEEGASIPGSLGLDLLASWEGQRTFGKAWKRGGGKHKLR